MAFGRWAILLACAIVLAVHADAIEEIDSDELISSCKAGAQIRQRLGPPPRKKPLNLIFQHINILPPSSGGTIMEFLWIRDTLLAKLQRPIRVFDNADSSLMMNNSLVVVLFELRDPDYFKKAHAAGYHNIGLYHMGDEFMGKRIDYYKDADYVMRNYYNENYLRQPRVHYLNLGIKSGTGQGVRETMLPSSMRSINCNFLGSVRANRAEMIDIVRKSDLGCYISADKRFEAFDSMHPIQYRNFLLDSRFTLAPWGENYESLRFYEAMEFGSIPIFMQIPDPNLDFIKSFGVGHPIPVIKNWTEVVPLIHSLSADPAKLDALQARIVIFWTCFKDHLQSKAARIINRAFADNRVLSPDASPVLSPQKDTL